MYSNKLLSVQNMNFNFEETKKKVNDFFVQLEKMAWELAKINAQKGLTVNYDFAADYQKQPFIPIGKDEFGLKTKENKEAQLKKYLSNYYWAQSILSEKEQIYIAECFINRKFEDEIVDLVDCISSASNEFRKLKRSAIYKFADFLGLVVENS
ncbi:MAG: hypothetical protein LBJ11_00495 [Oscillospiraceae bacterium]|jgi:hypothetical protein|nr:hypothetical protein [Oscillospiraceae bacterium]